MVNAHDIINFPRFNFISLVFFCACKIGFNCCIRCVGKVHKTAIFAVAQQVNQLSYLAVTIMSMKTKFSHNILAFSLSLYKILIIILFFFYLYLFLFLFFQQIRFIQINSHLRSRFSSHNCIILPRQ